MKGTQGKYIRPFFSQMACLWAIILWLLFESFYFLSKFIFLFNSRKIIFFSNETFRMIFRAFAFLNAKIQFLVEEDFLGGGR